MFLTQTSGNNASSLASRTMHSNWSSPVVMPPTVLSSIPGHVCLVAALRGIHSLTSPAWSLQKSIMCTPIVWIPNSALPPRCIRTVLLMPSVRQGSSRQLRRILKLSFSRAFSCSLTAIVSTSSPCPYFIVAILSSWSTLRLANPWNFYDNGRKNIAKKPSFFVPCLL